MLLNKKYKCPVCLEKCITLKEKLNYWGGFITCKNCNSYLRHAKIPVFIYSFFSYTLAGFIDYFYGPYDFPLLIIIFGPILFMLCLTFFVELEHYIPKPEYNLKEFLDNLKTQNSRK